MADETPRHRIEVACPECGETQAEPALVVSTQCRSCRANFQVREGKGVVAQGQLKDGVFVAREVLAKHDENYMPPEAAEAMKRAQEGKSKLGESVLAPNGDKLTKVTP